MVGLSTSASPAGGVDVLVNNAGIMRLATLEASDDPLIDTQIAVH
jgi:3-oxoacyl-[acyl-carrier protein] reductase